MLSNLTTDFERGNKREDKYCKENPILTDSVNNMIITMIRKRLFVKLAGGVNVYTPLIEKLFTLGRTNSLIPPFQMFRFKYLPGCIFFQASFRYKFYREEQTSWHIFEIKSLLIAVFNEHKLELICTNKFVIFLRWRTEKGNVLKALGTIYNVVVVGLPSFVGESLLTPLRAE